MYGGGGGVYLCFYIRSSKLLIFIDKQLCKLHFLGPAWPVTSDCGYITFKLLAIQ